SPQSGSYQPAFTESTTRIESISRLAKSHYIPDYHVAAHKRPLRAGPFAVHNVKDRPTDAAGKDANEHLVGAGRGNLPLRCLQPAARGRQDHRFEEVAVRWPHHAEASLVQSCLPKTAGGKHGGHQGRRSSHRQEPSAQRQDRRRRPRWGLPWQAGERGALPVRGGRRRISAVRRYFWLGYSG